MSSPHQAALKALRETKGLTRTQLADAAGIDRSTYSRIEAGITQDPGPDVLVRIAAHLGVQVAAITITCNCQIDRVA